MVNCVCNESPSSSEFIQSLNQNLLNDSVRDFFASFLHEECEATITRISILNKLNVSRLFSAVISEVPLSEHKVAA